MSDKPRHITYAEAGVDVDEGARADFTIFDLNRHYTIDPTTFLSMGHATPFEGRAVCGECLMTVCGGRIAWQKDAQ